MLSYSMSAKLLLGLVIAGLLVGACGSSPELPNVGKIESQLSEVMVGESVNFSIEAAGTELEFEWSAARGTIESQQAMAKYTAPDSPGEDTVQVHVTSKGETVVKSLTFNVVAPIDTPTPLPTDTQTPTTTPEPTNTPQPTLTDTPEPTDTPSPTPTNTPSPSPTSTPTATPNPTATRVPCQGANSEEVKAQLFEALGHENYEKALACTYELEERWEIQAKEQQAKKQALDCRYTPDPNNQAAFENYWAEYWALDDVAMGLSMRADVFRKQGKCSEAKEAYKTIMDAYSCAFAWDPSYRGFWSIGDAARDEYGKLSCP